MDFYSTLLYSTLNTRTLTHKNNDNVFIMDVKEYLKHKYCR